MKKSLLFTAALCGAMTANAELSKTDLLNNDYVGEWGRLKLVGNQLSAANGEAIQLKGWSTFSINYDDGVACLTQDGFNAMKAWGANIVRLACYVQNNNGNYKYDQSSDPLVQKYIKWASDLNMYVLLDWHILEGDGGSGDPNKYTTEAKGFFERHTSWCKQNGFNNVLYEICNEPVRGVSWSQIKSYADQVLPLIEKNDPGAIVVVGTREWDQYPDEAADSPIPTNKYPNIGIMYACHVYACTHVGTVDSRLVKAAAKVPIFVTEWGSVDADGNGQICTNNASLFLGKLEKEGNNGGQWISWCYWAWGQKPEGSNCIKNCSSAFTKDNLRPSGEFIYPYMTGGTDPEPPTPLEEWAIQDIPSTGNEYGVLNIAWWDKGEDGVAYHDNNSSAYEDDEHLIKKTGENAKATEAQHCNSGAIYADLKEEDKSKSFRYETCFDVTHSMAGLGANWDKPGDGYGTMGSDLHNLCSTEPGEWAVYTIDVKKKGYYTVHCLTNSNTSDKGTIGLEIVKGKQANQNGNIIRSWDQHNDATAQMKDPWFSFQLSATPKCGLYVDGTQDESGAANGNPKKDYTCWGWTACGGELADDLTVLFKYEGKQKLLLSISPDVKGTPGDFSNFLFTFKSDDIPDWEYESGNVPETAIDLSSVAVYPNPAENEFTVKTDGPANVSIFSATGTLVYNQDVENDVTVNNHYPAGIYTIRVTKANGVKSVKLVVK